MLEPPTSVSGPGRPLHPILRAAFALHHRPGGYVAVLGAGIPKPTGIKSAWEVLATLIGRVAASESASPIDPFEWWSRTYGADATYGAVLEAVAATREERRAVLQEFFEPTPEDIEAGRKLPSAAHRDLAQLVKSGHVRIVVTLNFDHLIEQAMREAGVEPTVVSSPAAITAMEPLHAQQHVIIHLHGEYQSPEVLNTPGELSNYEPAVEVVVRQIADEYGLLIAGWSATWDTRLVELLTPESPPRYATWWIEPTDTNDIQRRLGASRRAEFVESTADDAMSRLTAALEAVAAEAAKTTPLDIAVGIATVKRELRRGRLSVDSHDLIRQAIDDIATSPTVRPDRYELAPGDTEHTRSEAVLAVTHAAAAFVATLAYWGDEKSDRWWFNELERLGAWPDAGGSSALIDYARAPSTILLYTAGAAAVVADRWSLVRRLLIEPQIEDPYHDEHGPLLSILHPTACAPDPDSSRLARYVGGLLHRYVGVGVGLAVDAWERFEYLAMLTVMSGSHLPWIPCIRAAGSLRQRKAVPAVWLDTHLDVLQPFLNSPGWFDGGEATRRRTDFDAAFARHATHADYRVNAPGSVGMLPSGRHYPGSFSDHLDLDQF